MKQIISVKQIVLALAFLGLAACNPEVSVDAGADDQKPQSSYRTEPAIGLINGGAWLFLSGTAKPHYNDPSRISLSLFNEEFTDQCSGFSYGKANVLTSVPAGLGETRLGQMPKIETVTFSYTDGNGAGANLIATEGRITITEITNEEVSGFIMARYDGVNYINGAFKLKVCAQ